MEAFFQICQYLDPADPEEGIEALPLQYCRVQDAMHRAGIDYSEEDPKWVGMYYRDEADLAVWVADFDIEGRVFSVSKPTRVQL